MIVYKIVLVHNRKQYSCLAKGRARIQYYCTRKIQAPEWLSCCEYNICVFTTLETARNFWRNVLLPGKENFELWKCKVDRVQKPSCYCRPYSIQNGYMLVADTSFWPMGTGMVKELQLGKRICL